MRWLGVLGPALLCASVSSAAPPEEASDGAASGTAAEASEGVPDEAASEAAAESEDGPQLLLRAIGRGRVGGELGKLMTAQLYQEHADALLACALEGHPSGAARVVFDGQGAVRKVIPDPDLPASDVPCYAAALSELVAPFRTRILVVWTPMPEGYRDPSSPPADLPEEARP